MLISVHCAGGYSVRRALNQDYRQMAADLEHKILSRCSDGLCVKDVPNCGKGLFATKRFLENDFICVYEGEEITERQYKKRYDDSQREKCYTFHYQHDSRFLVVDATNEVHSLARMANHSWKRFNADMRRKVVRGTPSLVLFAVKDIEIGHEIRYNYGDQVVRESRDKYAWLSEIVDFN